MDSKKKNSLHNIIYSPLSKEIGRIFFYMGLIFEIIIFLIDRSAIHNPYQSMMFRVTFAFFVIKCILTEYDRREWIFIVVTAAFSILTYRLCGKDEVVRTMVFIIAMKGLDAKRTLKLNYLMTLCGVIIMGVLSVFGILGKVVSSGGYGDKADDFMVEFGLGSPNTWAIQIWLLVALFVYLYHDSIYKNAYFIILLLGGVIYMLTKCRMALVMIVFTAVVGIVFELSPRIRTSIITYIGGAVAMCACMAVSIYAAIHSKWWEEMTEFELMVDKFLTGRMQTLYAFENGGGVLSNWKLFGDPSFTQYFDLGYVRLFWWYGIIPGTLALIAVILLIVHQYKTEDYTGYLLLLSSVLFMVFEAHFISVFIARSFFLFLFGASWSGMLKGNAPEKPERHIAFYIGALSKGGAERVFINLSEYFLQNGYKVTFITQYKKEDEYPLPQGADRYISDLDESEQKGRIYNFFARVMKLHKIIRLTGADLLMTTIGKSNFMAIVCSMFLPTRVVVSVVAEPALEYPTKVMRILLQTLFGEADGIVMQTTRQQQFLRYGLRKRSVILHNSVNPDFAIPRYDGKRRHDICMVGRMDDNKNQAMAIRAFVKVTKTHPEARLILMGDGPSKDDLMKLASNLNIDDKVEFTGIVSDVPARLHKAYAFLLTSDTEGMPNTLLEAMSLGVACVSTDCPCGGPAMMIESGANGILVPVNDDAALADAMLDLLDSEEYMNRLGRAAQITMEAYSPETVNAEWKSYFDSVIGS